MKDGNCSFIETTSTKMQSHEPLVCTCQRRFIICSKHSISLEKIDTP